MPEQNRTLLMVGILVGMVPVVLLMAWLAYLHSRYVDLTVENPWEAATKVSLDGVEVDQAMPFMGLRFETTVGPHHLQVQRPDGTFIEEDLVLESPGYFGKAHYVYNTDDFFQYTLVTMGYGDVKEVTEQPYFAPARLFRAPSDVTDVEAHVNSVFRPQITTKGKGATMVQLCHLNGFAPSCGI